MVRLNTGKVPVITMPRPYRDHLLLSVHSLYSVNDNKDNNYEWRVVPKRPDTRWSTEPAWRHFLLKPWVAPTHRGTPDQTNIDIRPCRRTSVCRCFYCESERHKENQNQQAGLSCVRAIEKPTWVLILIAQMERISK